MKTFLTFAAGLILVPLFLAAQWSTNPAVNNIINNMAGEQAIPKIATCPNGDSYIGFFSYENGNYNVRMQRLDAQGNALWAANGILISNHPQMSWLTDWDMTADPDNHAILTFQDIRNGGNNNVVAYRISPSGGFAWGADGIALSNSTAFDASPKVCVTASGNAVFAWQADDIIIMKKVSPAGSQLWGDNGIILINAGITYSWPQLMPVGTDDIILKYFQDTGPPYSPTRHVFAQRYNASGAPVWSSPAVISNAGGISAWTQIFPIVNDGSDGFYIAWHDDRDNNMLYSSFMQHISSAGTAQLTANGLEVSTLGGRNHFYPQLALPPGSSDIYVFWNEMSANQNQQGIYGQKVSAAGNLLWGNNGMVFIEISNTQMYPVGARHTPTDVVVFYDENAGGTNSHLKAMRIDNSGGFVWSPSSKTICSVNSEKVHVDLNHFANNQWILSWEDNRGSDRDIYAQNIQLDGSLGPWDPQEGTITGLVTLVGGSASVTMVNVTAGTTTTHPAANGAYSMVVPVGTYDVIGSLAGYEPDTVFGVVVIDGQTTTGVNLTLNALPTGYMAGNVQLIGGTGNITEVEIMAGYHTTNPDTNGNYQMEIETGTYDVVAYLSGYLPDTNFSVSVSQGQTTDNVDFELNVIPTTGFITGQVQLENNAGDVTQVVVMAGTTWTHPGADGIYLLEVTAGTWDVSASLEGFLTQFQLNIPVFVSQTTVGVNFFLYLEPDVGYIEGTVSLVNGTGDVTQAIVSAGNASVSPSDNGNYFLVVEPGTYTVHATHPFTLPDSVTGIQVTAGLTASNVNFALEVVRADLVCQAVDNYNNVINDVSVEIEGPEGTYTGTIINDSLVFENLPYGDYNGMAWLAGGDPVYEEIGLGMSNHHMIFVFDLTGLDAKKVANDIFRVRPNPFSTSAYIEFFVENPSRVTIEVRTPDSRLAAILSDEWRPAGLNTLEWQGTGNNGMMLKPGLYFVMVRSNGQVMVQPVIKY